MIKASLFVELTSRLSNLDVSKWLNLDLLLKFVVFLAHFV